MRNSMQKRPLSNDRLSDDRRRRQGGVEAIEFAIFFTLTLPMFVWMFINGMNFIILDKVNDVTRAAGLMLIKSQDFTLSGTQEIVARVASGLNLQVGTTGGVQGTSTGSGLVIISKIQYIGTTTCSNCTNVSHYVFLSRIYVGNTSLQFNGTTVASAFGSPNSTLWSTTTGDVSSTQTNTGAQTNAAFGALFGATPIADSETVYVVESYFTSASGFGAGQFGAGGAYARVLM